MIVRSFFSTPTLISDNANAVICCDNKVSYYEAKKALKYVFLFWAFFISKLFYSSNLNVGKIS